MSTEYARDNWTIKWLPPLAAIVAFGGILDAVYLVVHHYTNEPVPCSITGGGCEAVLTSMYATIGGIPLAVFGALAYFTAFVLALFTAFGNRRLWTLYGLLATLMAGFSMWLLYLQAFIIKEFCQYCLVSAATSSLLFIIFVVYLLLRPRRL